MAVEGGPVQPAAPNVLAAAMKIILPGMRRKEEGKSRRGRAEARAAGSGDSGIHTGGQVRTGRGGKGQAGASGARHETGHQEGKGGKGGGHGRHWPQPQRSFKQPPRGLPPQVSAAMRAEEEREACRQQAERYEALAHKERQRCRQLSPEPGPDTIYRLELGSGSGRSERQGGQEGSRGVHSGQCSGGLQRGEGQAGQSSAAAAGRHGQREGGQESGSQQGGQAGSAVQGRDAGLEEGGNSRHSGYGAQGKGAGQEGRAGEQAARGTGKRSEGTKGRGRRVAVGTWAHQWSQGRD